MLVVFVVIYNYTTLPSHYDLVVGRYVSPVVCLVVWWVRRDNFQHFEYCFSVGTCHPDGYFISWIYFFASIFNPNIQMQAHFLFDNRRLGPIKSWRSGRKFSGSSNWRWLRWDQVIQASTVIHPYNFQTARRIDYTLVFMIRSYLRRVIGSKFGTANSKFEKSCSSNNSRPFNFLIAAFDNFAFPKEAVDDALFTESTATFAEFAKYKSCQCM